jgi:UDP-N-acetylmuramoyl-tripeptide--D-alanyl-D-alanine ligase
MAARFTAAEVRQALGLPPTGPALEFASVSTDTRSLEPGALFVALRGERFDGARFVSQAESLGAAAAVVSDDSAPPASRLPVFPVANTTRALGELARFHRRRAGARVVGITGSSGKTTVKEMLTCALGSERSVHATEGNLNNQVGLPLSILAADEEADVWVLELGTNEPGEIRRLTEIAEPDDAVITTVGPAHLEGLGSVAGVLEEKLDLLRGASREGCAVVGELPPALPAGAREIRPDVVTAGLGPESDYRPSEWHSGPDAVRFRHSGAEYVVHAGGAHHLRDAIIAAAAASQLGISAAGAARGMTGFRPFGMRGALLQVGPLTILADCYNANPESFEAAIRHCADSFPDRRLAAVVGTMLELGSEESAAHVRVAESLLASGFTAIVALGAFQESFRALPLPRDVSVAYPGEVDDAADELFRLLAGDEVILVKASRGMRLERVIDGIKEGSA